MNIIDKFLGEALGEVLYNISEAQNTGDELWYRIMHPDTKMLERAVTSDGHAVYVIQNRGGLVAIKAKKPHFRANINKPEQWVVFATDRDD